MLYGVKEGMYIDVRLCTGVIHACSSLGEWAAQAGRSRHHNCLGWQQGGSEWLESSRDWCNCSFSIFPVTLLASSFIALVFLLSIKEVMFLPVFVCLFVCLWVSKITQKVMDGSFWNFEGMSGMAQTTSDSILEAIRQESWILDHFEIFVSMGLKGNRHCRYGAGAWQTTWRWLKVF